MGKKLFRLIKENTFEAPGVGSMNYQTPYGTPAGGNITQSPEKFSSSEKTVNHFNNSSTGSAVNSQLPERSKGEKSVSHTGGNMGSDQKDNTGQKNTGQKAFPKNDRKSSSGALISPSAIADKAASQTSLNPDQELDPQVDQMFQGKKNTPSPDELMSALQYELSNMVKKDKHIAKQTVLKNLKDDPQHYSRLNMLNIDDKKMKVDETTFEKTKAVLDEMIAARQKTKPTAESPELNQIFKDLTDKRNARKGRI